MPQPDELRDALVAALGAQYEVLGLIGRGGMGAVYLGRERLLDRAVAIKVLPYESADTGGARDRFLREARIAARLTHPNVVPLYSFGEAGRTLFYVMGFVEGESLEQLLNRVGRLPHDQTRRILGEITAALEHAHGHGIVHRDLKPDNVLIEARTGRAVLADFGIARRDDGVHLTQTGVIVGTPHYMSPEQASGDTSIDGRSDLYSLGVMGYRMVAGRLPFEGNIRDLISQHITQDPAPLNVVVPDVPADIDAAIARCLAKDPSARWQNAESMRESLRSGDVTFALPDEMERFPGSGSRAAAAMVVGTWALAMTTAATGDSGWARLIPVAWAGAFIGVGIMAAQARKTRLSWKRLWQIAFWQPGWWKHWWPRALRRPGDVWDRLPRTLRLIRGVISSVAVSIAAVFGPVFVLGLVYAGVANDPDSPAFRFVRALMLIGVIGQLGGLVILLVAYLIGLRWLKRFGFAKAEADRVLVESTAHPHFWTRPALTRMLQSESPSSTRAPQSATQLAEAIEQASSAVDAPARALIGDAAGAARDMARAIQLIDDELHELSRHGDDAERVRVEQKLAALGAARDNESAAAKGMREVFVGQLALLRELSSRAEALAARRSRYLELLRTLWLQVSALRSQRAADALSVEDVTGRIRVVLRDAQLLASADQQLAETIQTPGASASPRV